MFLLHLSTSPPPGYSFTHQGNSGLLQTPDGNLHPLDIITPDIPGDAPFAEFNNLLISIIDSIPHFALT